MSEDCDVKGKVTTAVQLSLVDSYIDYGKWTDGPYGTIPAGSNAFQSFRAQGRKGTATGTNGNVVYIAPDKAKFKLSFDDPYSQQNQATITGIDGPIQKYTYTVNYPSSGKSWDANYSISLISGCENEITTDKFTEMTYYEFERMVLCNEFPLEKIRDYMEGKESVTIQTVLHHKKIPAQLKVWLVVNGSFLSNSQQRQIAIEFANHIHHIAEKSGNSVVNLTSILEKAKIISESDMGKEFETLCKSVNSAKESGYKAIAASDSVIQALNPDVSSALRNATTCAYAAVGDTEFDKEVAWQLDFLKKFAG